MQWIFTISHMNQANIEKIKLLMAMRDLGIITPDTYAKTVMQLDPMDLVMVEMERINRVLVKR